MKRIISFVNRTFNQIQCSFLKLKERYRGSVIFKFTKNDRGLLSGYFEIAGRQRKLRYQ